MKRNKKIERISAYLLENFTKIRIKTRLLSNTYSMIKPTKTISDVKRFVKNCSSKRVDVKVNLGRNKTMRFSGVPSGVYPALFTVKPDDETFLGKTAYSYSDLLCGTVKIKPL